MAPNGSGGSGSSKKQSTFIYCEGSSSWTPDTYLSDAELHARAAAHLAKDDLKSAIAASFALRATDSYVYHAIVAVTLPQVQHIVSLGGAHGLHNWYFGEPPADPDANDPSKTEQDEQTPPSADTNSTSESKSKPSPPSKPQAPPVLPPPPQPDIEAYLSIFSPANASSTALKNYTSNAKKGSLRREIGSYLSSKRYIHPSLNLTVPRIKASASKPAPANPYLTFLSWPSAT